MGAGRKRRGGRNHRQLLVTSRWAELVRNEEKAEEK
jgi:hypothetical protein